MRHIGGPVFSASLTFLAHVHRVPDCEMITMLNAMVRDDLVWADQGRSRA
jgi:hypothetical protein